MIKKLLRFMRGEVRLYAEKEYSNRLVSFLTSENIRCTITPCNEKGGVYADISPYLLKKIASSLDKSGIIVYIINIWGFARFSSKYRARSGLLVGAVIFALILWASTLFVWRVELDGSELISKDTLRAELSEMGVRPGCLISDIDKTKIANDFLSLHPELSWAALNFNGTTVSLTVKETLSPPSNTEKHAPLLVAKYSGIISYIGVYEGSAAVKVGTVVKKGDVLISGYVSGSGLQITDTPLLRPGNARGDVKAEISGQINASCALEEIGETQCAGDICGRTVSVFGKELSFGNTDLEPSERKNVTVFGFIELPITVQTYKAQFTESKTVTRTSEEALLCAKQRAYTELSKLYPDCEVVSMGFEVTEYENEISVILNYKCITDIAEKKYLTALN